jgi:predicted nucleic acid-binding protein
MEFKRFLIDTNVAIEYIGEILNEEVLDEIDKIINSGYYISVINKIELLGFHYLSESENEKFSDFIKNSETIGLDEIVVDKTIEIRRSSKIKLPDAIIAATALVYDLTLLTRNIKDFQKIPGLKFLNPQTDF